MFAEVLCSFALSDVFILMCELPSVCFFYKYTCETERYEGGGHVVTSHLKNVLKEEEHW